MRKIFGRIVLFVLLFAIWFLLTYPFDIQETIVGLSLAFIISVLPLPGSKIFAEFRFSPKAVFNFIVFGFVFLYCLIKANIDVAFRVIRPRLNINPGIVKIRTKLKSSLGRALLANAITLTPGTITVDARGEFFYIHWIDVKTKDVDEASRQIMHIFEKFLEPACG